jgi:hypothetical protein
MIKKSLLTLVITCSMFGSIICADQDAQINRLLTAMNFKKTIKSMLVNGIEAQVQQLPAEQAAILAITLKEVENYFASDKFEDAVKSIYKSNFTAEEISQIADFYSSEVGQKMVAKTPALTQATIETIQTDLLPIMQRAATSAANSALANQVECTACSAECQTTN